MQRAGRHVSLILFALASVSAAHALAYLITFRCWACHDSILNATHAAIAGSASCALAILVLIATIAAARHTRAGDLRPSPARLLLVQALVLISVEVFERHGASARAVSDPGMVVELGLMVLGALLFARFAKVVENVARAKLTGGAPFARSSLPRVRWSPHPSNLPHGAGGTPPGRPRQARRSSPSLRPESAPRHIEKHAASV